MGIETVVDEKIETTSDGVHDAACSACEMAVVWIQNQLKLNLNQTEEQILNYANEVTKLFNHVSEKFLAAISCQFALAAL